jgi:hypothetical protein
VAEACGPAVAELEQESRGRRRAAGAEQPQEMDSPTLGEQNCYPREVEALSPPPLRAREVV